MIAVRISPAGAVTCRAAFELPLAPISVWGQIRDFSCYARQDFFHDDPQVEGIPRRGAAITLTHRYAALRFRRVGRILVWREGVGYSFSDLSRRGPRVGFPHVFSYRIEPLGPDATRLHVVVRGRWTARWIPHLFARLWLWWVFGHVVRSIRNELLLYRVWRKRHKFASSAG